jgi:hypothetical protein
LSVPKSGERQSHAEIKGKIERSSGRKQQGEAPEQVQLEPVAVKSMLMDIAIYERDGRGISHDYNWRLLVLGPRRC